MQRHRILRYALLSVAACLLALAAFSPSLHGAFFGDDFLYRARDLAPSPGWFFLHPNPVHAYAYRPLEFSLIWIAQDLGRGDTIWIHLPQLLLHLGAAGLLVAASRSLGLGRRTSLLAGAFLLLSQAGAHAVCSNDTVSQILGTVLGWGSAWLFHRALSAERSVRRGILVLALGAFALSLAGKETSLSFSPVFAGIAAWTAWRGKRTWAEAGACLLPFAAAAIGYMALRRHLGLPTGSWGDGTYDFHLGRNLLVNPILVAAQSAMPVSSAAVVLAAKSRAWAVLALAGASALSVAILPLWGHLLSRSPARLAALAFGTMASVCLVIPMNHISELYVYAALPVFAIFFASGLRELHHRAGRLGKVAVASFAVAVLCANAAASRSKSVRMADLGARAALIEPQLERAVDSLPQGRPLVLVETTTLPTYSVFLQPGFVVVCEGPRVHAHVRWGRSLAVPIVPPSAPIARDPSQTRFQLVDGTKVVPFP